MQKSVIQELKQQNKQHEFQGLFRMLIYRHFSIPLTSVLVHTNIPPNLVTTLSLILAFVSAFFYYRADYASLVIGTVILNISLILDHTDGELARYKKINSSFGAWWDGVCDKVTEYVIFLSLTLGLYFRVANSEILILGLFGLANLMMISVIRSLNRIYLDAMKTHELNLGKFYLAGGDTFIVLVTIAALLNQVYYFLWVYSVLGALMWIRQIYRAGISYKKNK